MVLILPYVFVLALALAGFNVMALLFSGTVLSAVIGGALGKFAFFDVMDLLGKGTLGMGETLIVGVAKGLDMRIDSLALLKCLYYQPMLALAVFASMLFSGRRSKSPIPMAA